MYKEVAIVDVAASGYSACATDKFLSVKINQILKTLKCRYSISDNEGLIYMLRPEKFLGRNVERETFNVIKGEKSCKPV
jgi:hypothetical protein